MAIDDSLKVVLAATTSNEFPRIPLHIKLSKCESSHSCIYRAAECGDSRV